MLRILFRIIHPLFLINGVLLYLLGIGMAGSYNGIVYWDLAVLGQLWLLALQLGGLFLYFYFNRSSVKNVNAGSSEQFSRPALLLISYTLLAIVASLSVLVIRVADDPSVFLLMSVMLCGVLSYSIPPIRLANSGYGEFTLSLMIASFTPALGYILQGGDSLRILTMVTFPLTVLHLAMLLAFSLSTYASDMKLGYRTMMLRMGWQNGMLLHNILILFTYLLLMLAITFGLPWQVGIPALLTLPIGLFQIWTINRIAAGYKPQWRSLRVTAMALFGITVYLLTFSFWIRYMGITLR